MPFSNPFPAVIVTLFSTENLKRHLITCSESLKFIYPRNIYQIPGTLFDQPYFLVSGTQVNKNLRIFDFESTYANEETFKDTKTTTWIAKHVPISIPVFVKPCGRTNFSLQLRSS